MAFCVKSSYGISNYQPAGEEVPDKILNFLQSSIPPLQEKDDCKTATRMVMQYLCAIYFRHSGGYPGKCSDATVDRIYSSACQLDTQHDIQAADSGSWPSLVSIMEAVKLAKLSKFPNVTPEYFNSVKAAKTYIHRFGAIIMEINYSDQLLSKKDYTLTAGEEFEENVSKIFIAYGYGDGGFFCMDNLGPKKGYSGMVKIPDSVLDGSSGIDDYPKILIKGAVFANCY